MEENEVFGAVDSGSSSEPSVTVPDSSSVPDPSPVDPSPEPPPDPEPAPVDPSPEPPLDPEPAPVDPSPEPSPDPEPVEPLPSDPVGPSLSDPDEGVVLPGEDSSVGGEQLPGGDENQQPGVEAPGAVDQLPGGDENQQPGVEAPGAVDQLPPVSNLPPGLYSLPQTNTPVELVLDNVETFQLSPIEDSTGLKGVLLRILGPYDNIVTQYRYQQSNNQYYTYVNEVTPDYPWIASAVLFIVLLVSLFGLLKRGMSWMK